ncbi:MAG: ATP-binding protein [Lachnospiraceae bacterium]|nr:ATP-binding protein [Lachnospiraceae bacterium]
MKRLAALGTMRVSLAVKGRVDSELYERYDRILAENVSVDELLSAEAAAFEESAEGEAETPAEQRINRFMGMIAADPVVKAMAELTALRLLEPCAAEVLEIISRGNGDGVTLLTAARSAGAYGRLDEVLLPCREAQDKVRFFFRPMETPGVPYYLLPYRMDDWLLGFLAGSDELDRAFADFAEIRNPEETAPEIFGMEGEIRSLIKRLEAVLKAGEKQGDAPAPVTALISGDRESGRYTAACAASKALNIPTLAVDFSYLMGTQEPKEVLSRVVRSCALWDRALIVRGIEVSKDTVFLIERLQRLYHRYCTRPLFLLTSPEVKLAPSMRGRYLTMRIPKGADACLALWKGYLPKKHKKLAESLASKMALTAGQVRRVVQAMETVEGAGEKIDERVICRLCYEVLDDGRYDNVKRVEPGFTLDDVKIDAHNRSVLEDICRQVELRHQVYDGWGLKKKYAYGRCVSVILAGPPGTGKTMTVHALAGQLGLELYKVDLSQIVDKYIGETEKRLEEVFARAQKSNMILFFDEADAVMGKRSEVKEAKDKYANTEISFILQRIEEYDGIVLLATNNLQNIDNAFMRRIRYVLSFQLPDKETREEIWRSAFGSGVPLSDDIDYPFLADKFELSGGEIKNIVLNAVFYGAADGGEVAMRHIMKAVYRENTKLKRIAFDGDYGGYAYLLHD